MLPQKIALSIVTAERRVLTEEIDEIVLPASGGYLGVRPGHTPLLAALGTGVLTYTQGGKEHHLAVNRGFVEVLPDRIEVLAETAERPSEIDIERAKASRQRAEERMTDTEFEADLSRAGRAIIRAENRLTVSGKK